MTRKCGQNYAGGINHRDDYTDKTPDVDFRTYNRMPQDQTVQGAENVSCLWTAEIHLHFRSFPPSSEFSGDFPEVFGNFRRFFRNFRRFSAQLFWWCLTLRAVSVALVRVCSLMSVPEGSGRCFLVSCGMGNGAFPRSIKLMPDGLKTRR